MNDENTVVTSYEEVWVAVPNIWSTVGIRYTTVNTLLFWPVLWIRIGFNADPDPAFYLNSDPDPGSQTSADPDSDPGQNFR